MARSSTNSDRPTAASSSSVITDVVYHDSEQRHAQDASLRHSVLLYKDARELISHPHSEAAARQEVLDKKAHTATDAVLKKLPKDDRA